MDVNACNKATYNATMDALLGSMGKLSPEISERERILCECIADLSRRVDILSAKVFFLQTKGDTE